MERGIEETMKQTKNLNYEKILEIFRNALGNYMKEGYRLNEKREAIFLGEEKEVASFKETISAFFPPSYHQFFSKELSNDGDINYHMFKETCFNYKYQFAVYYIQKRFYSSDKKVESFIKSDENIIPIKVGTPKLYIPALGSSVLICITLLLIALHLIKRGRKNNTVNSLSWIPKPGVLHFKLLETEKERDNAFSGFESSAVCLEKDESEIGEFLKIRMIPFVNYFLNISGIDKGRFFEVLELFGVQIQNVKMDNKLIKKIYTAIILAHEDSSVVINDFIRNEDSDFYGQFEDVIKELVKTGISVLYLSSQMYTPKSRENILKIADITEIDINVVSLK